MRLALSQLNTTIGDFKGNLALIEDGISRARSLGVDIVAFPELAVCGYPPEDLALSRAFVSDNIATLRRAALATRGIVSVIGFIDRREEDGTTANAAAIISDGRIEAIYRKVLLPNYGVFDEKRYFVPGSECPVFDFLGATVGVSICEDIWERNGPSETHRGFGTELIININASPYEMNKQESRRQLVSGLAERNRAFVAYVNQVGGQDELVFEGGSLVASPFGEVIAEMPLLGEALGVVDIDMSAVKKARRELASVGPTPKRQTSNTLKAVKISVPLPKGFGTSNEKPNVDTPAPVKLSRESEIYSALVLGTKDYVRKTGFSSVAIGLSGGIDSSLTACVAVDALGAENVLGVALPSRFSSEGSLTDAVALAENLGIELWTIPIESAHAAFESMLAAVFEGTDAGTAEENIQARIRGTVMMAISNKFGKLVLTTGNKSENATGYATLYGDMVGGFAVIKDIFKTTVYDLCRYRNGIGETLQVPETVLEKPPSAELRPNQTDQDSLPEYEVLDRILLAYIEQGRSAEEIITDEAERGSSGADEATVLKTLRLVDLNEYKRRQSPPGVKITSLAFGRDRRLPIASAYGNRR